MMKIPPFLLPTEMQAPVSKSYLQRELLLSLISDKPSILLGNFHYLPDDACFALKILEDLGAQVHIKPSMISINPPTLKSHKEEISFSIGESGFLLRTMLTVGFLFGQKLRISAEGTMLNRDIKTTLDAFEQMGITLLSNRGSWPMVVEKGNLAPSHLVLDASDTSQLATGILIAMTSDVSIKKLTLLNPVSLPYLAMTLETLAFRGFSMNQEGNSFYLEKKEIIDQNNVQIQGDWSGASYLLCMAAIRGQIRISGLTVGSNQADEKILSILSEFGAKIEVSSDGVFVESNEKRPFEMDITHCPDLFPALAILAACAKGVSEISGIHRLYNKESNRLQSTSSMLSALDVTHEINADVIRIYGGMEYSGKLIYSHGDHRIVLATVFAAYALEKDIFIDAINSVKKSYPEMKHLIS